MDELEVKREPVPTLGAGQGTSQSENARLTEGDRARPLSSFLLPLLLVLTLAGAGCIGYLSLLSSNTQNLIQAISLTQHEAEQLRRQLLVNSPQLYAEGATASFRGSLLALKDGDARRSHRQQINALVMHGGQFAEQAEQVGFTNNKLQIMARHLSDRVQEEAGTDAALALYQQLAAYLFSVLHASPPISGQDSLNRLNAIRLGFEQQAASLSAVEKQQLQDVTMSLVAALSRYFQYRPVADAVTRSSFPDELRQLKSTLFQYGHQLTQLTRLFTLLVAVSCAGSMGILMLRREQAEIVQREAVAISPEPAAETQVPCTQKNMSVLPEKPQACCQAENAGSQEPVLDTQRMLDNMDGDRESVVMLLEVFLEDHSNDAQRLSACLDKSQSREVGLIAHSLKGIAGSFGAEPLRRIAECIEHRCKQGLAIEAEHISQLSQAIEMLKIAISEFMQPGSSSSSSSSRAGAADEVQVEGFTEAEKAESKAEPPVLLDIAYVLATMDGDADSVKLLLGIFIEEHALDAKRLQQLVYQCAPEAISETACRLIHSLKGVAVSLGAEALKQQAESIESRYKQHQVVADAEYRKLAIVLDDTVEAARHYLAELPAIVA